MSSNSGATAEQQRSNSGATAEQQKVATLLLCGFQADK